MAQRVLIVEDEPDIRDLLVFHLERDGYQVAKARNGVDALRQAQVSPPGRALAAAGTYQYPTSSSVSSVQVLLLRLCPE